MWFKLISIYAVVKKALGAPCEPRDECRSDFSSCQSGSCRCNPNYYAVGDLCIARIPTGDRCSPDDRYVDDNNWKNNYCYTVFHFRCLDLSASCIDGICTCLSRFFLKNGVCTPKISLGGACDPLVDTCLDSRAVCESSSRTCACGAGYFNKVSQTNAYIYARLSSAPYHFTSFSLEFARHEYLSVNRVTSATSAQTRVLPAAQECAAATTSSSSETASADRKSISTTRVTSSTLAVTSMPSASTAGVVVSPRTSRAMAGASDAAVWTRHVCSRACARNPTRFASKTKTCASVALDSTKKTQNAARSFPPEVRVTQTFSAPTRTRTAVAAHASVDPSSSSCKASADRAGRSLHPVSHSTPAPTTTLSAATVFAHVQVAISSATPPVFRAFQPEVRAPPMMFALT